MYKTLIRPLLRYGNAMWTMNQHEEEKNIVFERRVLRRMLRLVKVDGGC